MSMSSTLNLPEKIWKTTVKNQMIFMLAVLSAVGILRQGAGLLLPQVLICVLSAVCLDYIIVYIKFRKKFFSTSAIISGLILALILKPGVNWYVLISAVIIAIGSKYIIRIKGKHIFNPANFGLLFCMFVFRTYLVWWGAGISWLVLVLGCIIAYRFKRFHLILSFLITQSVLLGIYFALTGAPVLRAVLMSNPFFAFVMLVEPKTSPANRKGRIIYGVLTGIFSSGFIMLLPGYDPSVTGLALSNLLVPVINSKVKG